VLIAPDQRQMRSLSRKGAGDSGSHSLGGAGDDRDASGKLQIHIAFREYPLRLGMVVRLTRCAPSPQRGEGRGEGITNIRDHYPLTLSLSLWERGLYRARR